MKRTDRGHRVKGFTLTELIVVLAIIGILAGILAPTMTTYYRKSRIKAANTNARMVYNAAQTVAQTYISRDRGASTPSSLSGLVIISYYPGSGTTRATTAWGAGATAHDVAELGDTLVRTVNRTVAGAEDICWTVCISNYIVQGAVAADSEATDRVGYYTANKSQADDVTGHTYSQWISDTNNAAPNAADGVNTLRDVCAIYENAVSPTEAEDE